jgi:hypothetical protein
MRDKGHLRNAEKRERLKDYIVARLEDDAREGREATPSRLIAEGFGTSHKTCDKVFLEMRREGRLTWRTAYHGSPLRQVRVITVPASGLTTAVPAPVEKKPRKPRAFVLKNRRRIEKIGISDTHLYGTLEGSVKILRHRGFVVYRERGGFRVGNQLLDTSEMLDKAAREQRLMEAR